MTLDEQLVALCAQHDLINLSISIHMRDNGSKFFAASAHAMHNGKRICGSDTDTIRPSVSYALRTAIEDVNAQRAMPVIVDELEAAQ